MGRAAATPAPPRTARGSSPLASTALVVTASLLLAGAVLPVATVRGVRAAELAVDIEADAPDSSPGDGACQTDVGGCSLRAAIQEANASAGADTIDLPAGVFRLSIGGKNENATATGDLDISGEVTIQGSGDEATFIDGIGQRDRLLHVMAGATVVVRDLALINGANRLEEADLDSPMISGGAILNEGSVVLEGVTLSGSFSDAAGGAIYNAGGSVTLLESVVTANAGDTSIIASGGGTLTVDRSTVAGNVADSTITNGNGTVTITNSTVSGNVAYGAVVENQLGVMTVTSSTVVENVAGASARLPFGLAPEDVSRTDNPSAAVTNRERDDPNAPGTMATGTVRLTNTIVAYNTLDCSGPIESGGHNLDRDGTCGLTGDGDLPQTDPALDVLRQNDGPTPTHAVLSGSPLIDAGSDCGETDQRGVPRAETAPCDIGAYDVSPDGPFPDSTPVPRDEPPSGALVVDSAVDAADAEPGDGTCASSAGDCTLRAAIQEANADAEAVEIVLPASLYRLTVPGAGEDAAASGDLDVTGEVTITGDSAEATVIDGAMRPDRIFHVLAGGSLTLADLTISGGWVPGIQPAPDNPTPSDEQLRSGQGGGILNQGRVSLVSARLVGNTAGGGGGGLYNENGEVSVVDSVVSGNWTDVDGGALFSSGRAVEISNSTFVGNMADSYGGALAATGGSLTVTSSTITGNFASYGAALANRPIDPNVPVASGGAAVSFASSTISANVHFCAVAALTGAVDNEATVRGSPEASVALANTIVAYNLPNCAAPVQSAGSNLDSDGSCALAGAGDLSGVDPLLGVLTHDGAPTPTTPLQPGSPAIAAGAGCPPADQRGVPYPDGRCDIGAVAFAPFPEPAPPSASPGPGATGQTSPAGSPAATAPGEDGPAPEPAGGVPTVPIVIAVALAAAAVGAWLWIRRRAPPPGASG